MDILNIYASLHVECLGIQYANVAGAETVGQTPKLGQDTWLGHIQRGWYENFAKIDLKLIENEHNEKLVYIQKETHEELQKYNADYDNKENNKRTKYWGPINIYYLTFFKIFL